MNPSQLGMPARRAHLLLCPASMVRTVWARVLRATIVFCAPYAYSPASGDQSATWAPYLAAGRGGGEERDWWSGGCSGGGDSGGGGAGDCMHAICAFHKLTNWGWASR